MAAGDGALQREITVLYSDHHGWLRSWLGRRLGDAHQAADLAHETFLRLLVREEPVAAREPRAFLTTVAQRVLANHYRRAKLERAYLEALAQLPPQLAMSAEEQAILMETLDQVDQMLDGLPRVVKRAFLMSQLDEMSHAQVALALGISVSTVKRHLLKAGLHCYFAPNAPQPGAAL